MNDEVKEILIELIEYYNTVGAENDPGFTVLAKLAKRSSKILAHQAHSYHHHEHLRSGDVDPFALGIVKKTEQEIKDNLDPIIKQENDW